jgi:hypothetical protein
MKDNVPRCLFEFLCLGFVWVVRCGYARVPFQFLVTMPSLLISYEFGGGFVLESSHYLLNQWF